MGGLVVDGDVEPRHRPLGDERGRLVARRFVVKFHIFVEVIFLEEVEFHFLQSKS